MRDPEREDLVEKGDIWDWIPTLIAFLVIYAVLFVFYKPNLLFSLTTTVGRRHRRASLPGAVPHPGTAAALQADRLGAGLVRRHAHAHVLLPVPVPADRHLQLDPARTSSPSRSSPCSGVFALPGDRLRDGAAAGGCAGRSRRWRPSSRWSCCFMQSYSIYGGNILSTLAGEFGYMLSFALVFLFLGTVYRGMEKPRFNMLFVLNCLILMALVLSHIVPTIALVFIAPGLLLVQPALALARLSGRRGGGRLRAHRLLVAAVRREPSVDGAHGLGPAAGWKDFLPTALYPVAVLAVVGVAFAVAKRESKLLPLALAQLHHRSWSTGSFPAAGCGTPASCPSGTSRCICGRRTASTWLIRPVHRADPRPLPTEGRNGPARLRAGGRGAPRRGW